MQKLHLSSIVAVALLALPLAVAADEPLKVFTTLPDLGSIAREVGGDQVTVTVMLKGGEDPHFVEAKPSFIKQLSESDIFVQAGLELETGYAPLLLQNARNSKVLPGQPGYVDASRVITPMELPSGQVDRSMGDVHPFGNPHYWLDPLNGVRVARLLCDTFETRRPASKDYFEARYADFARRINVALVGAPLAAKYDAAKLALLYEHGKLEEFLRQQGDADKLGGWLGLLAPYRGAKAIDDHNMWPYFARRFGIEIDGHMEPKPGIPPTTSHLGDLVARMKADNVPVIIAASYYDPRHARFLADATGAQVVPLAHITGSRPGTDEYISMIDYNVRQLAAALAAAGSK